MTELDDQALRTLDVRSRSILGADGRERVSQTVHCPQRQGSLSAEGCRSCGRARELVLGAEEASPRVVCVGRGEEPLATALETPVRRLMTVNVRCVETDVLAEEVCMLFLEERISSVPVVDRQGRLQGLVSKTDLLWPQYEAIEQREHETFLRSFGEAAPVAPHVPSKTTAADLMSVDVVAIAEERSIGEAVQLMSRHRIHRLPVVDHEARVVGVLSSMDVVAWLALQFEPAGCGSRGVR